MMATKQILLTGLVALSIALVPPLALASDTADSATADAWLKGKIEMALLLNRYLNSFKIHTRVEQKHVTLSGKVESDIDKDLAGQIVLGIEGVDSLDNDLEVAPDETTGKSKLPGHGLYQHIQDVTLTAEVKSKLVLNNNIKARYINVDTSNNIVTLKGKVGSAQERELALQIARNTDNVKDVRSELQIRPAS